MMETGKNIVETKKKIPLLETLQYISKGGFQLTRSRKRLALPTLAELVQYGFVNEGTYLNIVIAKDGQGTEVTMPVKDAEVEVSFLGDRAHRIWIRTPDLCVEPVKKSKGGGVRTETRLTLLVEFRHKATDAAFNPRRGAKPERVESL